MLAKVVGPLDEEYMLRQCLTFTLQKAMARLCTLEFGLHQAQRLPRREDGLPILE